MHTHLIPHVFGIKIIKKDDIDIYSEADLGQKTELETTEKKSNFLIGEGWEAMHRKLKRPQLDGLEK